MYHLIVGPNNSITQGDYCSHLTVVLTKPFGARDGLRVPATNNSRYQYVRKIQYLKKLLFYMPSRRKLVPSNSHTKEFCKIRPFWGGGGKLGKYSHI
jgi:hypothetical protein